jgi:hypothetical protein
MIAHAREVLVDTAEQTMDHLILPAEESTARSAVDE